MMPYLATAIHSLLIRLWREWHAVPLEQSFLSRSYDCVKFIIYVAGLARGQ